MTRKNYTILFVIAMATAIFLNTLIVYINASQRDYISYNNISISKNTFEGAERILSSYDYTEYPQAVKTLSKEYEELTLYREALAVLKDDANSRYSRYDISKEDASKIIGESMMTDGEARARQEQIQYCIKRLNYAIDYSEYLSGIKSNVSQMSGTSIFKDIAYKNIIRAENDFYGLENVRVSAFPDVGVRLLFNDSITDILGVMTAVFCGLFYTLRCRTSVKGNSAVRSGFTLFSMLIAAGISALYIINIFVTDNFTDIGNLDRAIQSVEEYRSCPYMISVGTAVVVRIAFKTAACLIVYFICTVIFSSRKLRRLLPVLFLAAVDVLLYASGFRIKFSALFKSENIIGKYGNVFILGEAVSSTLILTIFSAALLLFSAAAAVRYVNGMLLVYKEEAEKNYYDEINNKYNETRQIRHDMKNHLTAVAILMDEGRVEDARKYLDDISVEMDNACPPLKTGSAVLDALLFKKLEDMKNNGISVNTEFLVSFCDVGISEYDLCGIFGNILDNANEASRKLTPENKKASLSVKRQMDMICIYCENRFAEINEDLSTMKADKKVHGIGLNRVRRIAEKYNGTMNITAENGVFTISIILNLKKK